MKNLCFVILLLIPVFAFTQSKNEIKTNKIKSRTIERTEQKDGVSVTYKESLEEYDKSGRTISKIEYNKSGDIKKKETFKYDSFGNLVEKTDYEKKTGLTLKTVSKYDAKGEKIEEIITDSSGNIVQKQVFTIDSKGLKKEARETNSKGELRWIKKYSYETY